MRMAYISLENGRRILHLGTVHLPPTEDPAAEQLAPGKEELGPAAATLLLVDAEASSLSKVGAMAAPKQT